MNVGDLHEQELHVINRLLAGDTEAYEELVRRYEKPIINYIFRLVQNVDEAMDIAQEVFVKAYYALDKYDSSYRFSTWLYRIARNAAIDNLRKRQGFERSLDEPLRGIGGTEVPLQVPTMEDTPEERVQSREFAVKFSEAVESLPTEYREVITLRHINECSYIEIADLCGIPIGTVKNRIFRGREMLRKKLEGVI